jgi:hypothetical protein
MAVEAEVRAARMAGHAITETHRKSHALAVFALARALDATQGSTARTVAALRMRPPLAEVLGDILDPTLHEALRKLVDRMSPMLAELSGARAEITPLRDKLKAIAMRHADGRPGGWARTGLGALDALENLADDAEEAGELLKLAGTLRPDDRLKLAPAALVGLSKREANRVLNDDQVRLKDAGFTHAEVGEIFEGRTDPEKRSKATDEQRKERTRKKLKRTRGRTKAE